MKIGCVLKFAAIAFLIAVFSDRTFAETSTELNSLSAQIQPCNSNSKRVALVIGNGSYRYSFSKANFTVPSARAVANKLCSVGFRVLERYDQNLGSFNDSIQAFKESLQDSEVGVFYYAGHGLQANGSNYLIPVDAKIRAITHVNRTAVNLTSIVDAIAKAKTRIIILDACRSNSFTERHRIADGLARIEALPETLVAFATSPRVVARDGGGPLTPYTQELSKWIDEKDLEVESLFRRIRIIVTRATSNAQRPWVDSSLTKAFYFNSTPRPKSVRRFWFDYSGGGGAPTGKREWELIDDMVWVERYPEVSDPNNPSGCFESTFSIVGRSVTIDGVTGTIVRKIDGRETLTLVPNGTMEVFIPNKDSNLMWAKFRHYDGANWGDWAWLGEMRGVE